MLTRRRVLTLTAALPLVKAGAALAEPLQIFTGHALGAKASLRLAHPDAAAIAARAFGEIDRLESIFSLYRSQSALMRRNTASVLAEPPFELLECLTLAGRVHAASGGRFDPTVQPLWTLYATAAAAGGQPAAADLAAATRGWSRVQLAADHISLDSGMALTLNGIAQGYIADRVAALLAAEGLTDVLIDTGELYPPRSDCARTRLGRSAAKWHPPAAQGTGFGHLITQRNLFRCSRASGAYYKPRNRQAHGSTLAHSHHFGTVSRIGGRLIDGSLPDEQQKRNTHLLRHVSGHGTAFAYLGSRLIDLQSQKMTRLRRGRRLTGWSFRICRSGLLPFASPSVGQT